MKTHPLLKLVFIVFAIYLVALVLHGCKKAPAGSKTVTTIKNDTAYIDSITHSSCGYAGDIISFSYHIAGSGTLSINSMWWDFGDGGGSGSVLVAAHTYSVSGTYQVTLHCNDQSVTTGITISDYTISSPYTHNMAGMRHWTGTSEGVANEFQTYYPMGTVDTQFAVQTVSDGIIQLPFYFSGLTLNLSSTDTVNKVLTFTACPSGTMTLKYFYVADSMVYANFWTPSIGHEYESFLIHSP